MQHRAGLRSHGLWSLRWLRNPAERSQARPLLHCYGQVPGLFPGI